MTSPRATAAACAALVIGVAGCGDRGRDDPIEVVKRYIESYDRGEEIVCDDLVTDGYLRWLGRSAGGLDGRLVCEQQIRAAEQFDVSVDVIPSVRERGDIVDVEVRLLVDGQQVEHELRLRRSEDGDLLVERSGPIAGGRPG